MKNLKTVARSWFIQVPEHVLNSAPTAHHHAEALVDIAVATSYQSLSETLEELNLILNEAMQQMTEYQEKSRGFHRSAMYKGRMLAFEDFINLLVREVKVYEERIEKNRGNNGKTDDYT